MRITCDVFETYQQHLGEYPPVEARGYFRGRKAISQPGALTLPVDLSGGKNAVQAIGSTVSYGKRYTASLLLNITTKGEDDDGRAAGAGSLVDDVQLAELRRLLADAGKSEARFIAYLKVPRLEALPRSRYAAACEALSLKAVQP